MAMAQREAKAPGAGEAGRRRRHVALELGSNQRSEEVTWAWWAATAVVAGVGLAGAGVLVWWAVAFHPAHRQLWMVPVGLVLLGTPIVTWLSLFASSACRFRAGGEDPAVAPAG